MRRSLALLTVLLVVPAASAATTPLHFTLFAQTDLPLGQALWTGSQWLFVAENLGKIEAADANGANVRTWASFDQGGEEMRCAVPPNKLWPDGVYCHTPDNRVVRLNRDGSGFTELARVPSGSNSDGAITFDDVGRFGYALLVATGGSSTDGGQLFAVRKDGRVQPLATYPGPGGAENLAVSPAGAALLAIDQDSVSGRLLAIDRRGNVTTVAADLGSGVNPVVVVKGRHAGGAQPGVYVADTVSQQIWFAPASEFAAGDVLVCTELTAQCWTNGQPVATDLPQRAWNLEGSAFVP